MSAFKWQRGKFHTFYSKLRIRVGGEHDVAIDKGEEFDYDGTILKYAGMELNSMSLRGAVQKGWADLKPEDGEIPEDQDVPDAHVNTRSIAKAQSVNKDLSRVERESPNSIERDSHDENTVLNVNDRRPNNSGKKVLGVPLDNAEPRSITNSRTTESAYSEEGISVGRVRTSAKLNVDVTRDSSRTQKLENINGSGYIPDQPVSSMFVNEGVKVSSASSPVGTEDDGIPVGSVRHTDTSLQSNPEDLHKKYVQKVMSTKKLPTKVRIARTIDPSFPQNWSFEGKLAERLKRAKDHGDTPTFIQALYAAEGDQMRKCLEKEYPKIVL